MVCYFIQGIGRTECIVETMESYIAAADRLGCYRTRTSQWSTLSSNVKKI